MLHPHISNPLPSPSQRCATKCLSGKCLFVTFARETVSNSKSVSLLPSKCYDDDDNANDEDLAPIGNERNAACASRIWNVNQIRNREARSMMIYDYSLFMCLRAYVCERRRLWFITFFSLLPFLCWACSCSYSSGNMHVHCTDVTRLLNRNVLFSVLAAIFLHNLFSYFPIHHWRLHYSLYHAHSLYTMPSRCNILLLPTGSRSIQRSERDVVFFHFFFLLSKCWNNKRKIFNGKMVICNHNKAVIHGNWLIWDGPLWSACIFTQSDTVVLHSTSSLKSCSIH